MKLADFPEASKLALVSTGTLFSSRNIHKSMISALGTRLSALLLTALGTPLILLSLGAEKYGALMVLSGITAWLSLSTFGLNGYVTSEVAKHKNDNLYVARILKTGARSTFIFATLAITIIAFVIYSASKYGWLGLAKLHTWEQAVACCVFLLFASYLQFLANPFEAARYGLQTVWVSNTFRLGANLSACVLVAVYFYSLPHTLFFAALALYLPITIMMLINAWTVVRLYRKELVSISTVKTFTTKSTLSQSAPFFVISFYAMAVSTFSTIYVSALTTTTEAATTSVFFRVIIAVMSMATIVTTPLWPAIISAYEEADAVWVKKILLAVFVPLLVGGAIACLAFAQYGNQIIRFWTGNSITYSPVLPVLCAILIFVMLWNHLWSTFLIGRRQQKSVSVIQIIEFLIIALLGITFIPAEGTLGLFKVMIFGMIFCSGIAFPVIALKTSYSSKKSNHLRQSR